MQFNSYIFILLFLPVFIFIYFQSCKVNSSISKWILILGSFTFYFYAGWKSVVVLGCSMVFNFAMSVMISKFSLKKLFLTSGIVGNMVLLLYFKYLNFFISNMNSIAHKEYPLKEIILPLGISFFTFQQIMYVVDVYRGDVIINPVDYMAYILYFPKILMGPLHEPKEFIAQLNDDKIKCVNWDNIACGIRMFSFGLFKKVVIADTFAAAVNWGFGNLDVATSADLALVMLFYTFEIYFDFSGYSDMAVGVSTMINISLPMNFDSPYQALSIRDFWKRWHLSLTHFFTKYIYISLGGSRKGEIRTYINMMIIFLISGLWHGANWTFLLWGGIHGAINVFDRALEKWETKMNPIVRGGNIFFGECFVALI